MWISLRKVQTANRRPIWRQISIDGQTKSIREWSLATGVPSNQIRLRLRYGWDPVTAVLTPTDYYRFRLKEKLAMVESVL